MIPEADMYPNDWTPDTPREEQAYELWLETKEKECTNPNR